MKKNGFGHGAGGRFGAGSGMTPAQKHRFTQSAQTPGDFAIGSENVLGGMFAELDAQEDAKIAAWKERQANIASREAFKSEVGDDAEQIDLF